MREIKFRAWVLGKMWEVRALSWNEDGVFITTDGGFMHLCEEDDVELMQYTGLLDKNGKEIYEGDILQWLDKLYVVESTLGGWNPFIGDMQTDGSWHYEVVGNIHENIVLLEK